MQTSPLKLIVGLGNPGARYQHNRHNVGAWYLAQLCRQYLGELRPESRFFGAMGRVRIAGEDLRLLFPTTYMNRSGQSVSAVCRYFNIEPGEMLVAYDEIDFPPGTVRLKHDGGHGGHNGMRDIIKALGGERAFLRLRIGVGHPGNASRVADYVLSDPGRREAEHIEASLERAAAVTPDLVAGQWQKAMTDLHTAGDPETDR